MSWVIDEAGSKSGVAKKVTEQLDAIAARHEGKEEAQDVLVAKDRILAIVEAVDLEPDESKEWNTVNVKASGSHTLSAKGVANTHMTISVWRSATKRERNRIAREQDRIARDAAKAVEEVDPTEPPAVEKRKARSS